MKNGGPFWCWICTFSEQNKAIRIYLINLTLAVKIKCLSSTTEAKDFWGFVFHCCLSHTQKRKESFGSRDCGKCNE